MRVVTGFNIVFFCQVEFVITSPEAAKIFVLIELTWKDKKEYFD